MIYNFVARAVLGDYFGTENSISPVLGANTDFSFEYNYLVPDNYNPENMHAIVFVLDDQTGEILNGDIEKALSPSSVPLVPKGKIALYPNPAVDEMNLSVEAQINDPVSLNIFDTNGRFIRSLGQVDLSQGNSQEKINVADLCTGAYLLELRHKNSVTALPFTKL